MKTVEKLAAVWLHWLVLFGLVLSVAVFASYAFGILPSSISPAESISVWNEPVKTEARSAEQGIAMFRCADFGDSHFMSIATLALLVSTALPVLAFLAFYWFLRGDLAYGFLSVAVSAVMVYAIFI